MSVNKQNRLIAAWNALRGREEKASTALFPSQGYGPQAGPFGGWYGSNGYQWDVVFPNTAVDFQAEAGEFLNSSLVMAVCLWIARNFPEAPLMLKERGADGKQSPVPDHAFLDLMSQPNPVYPGEVLWNASVVSLNLDGNAYWQKVRNARGQVTELWYIPHFLIEPWWPEGRSDVWIEKYLYYVGTQQVEFAPEDIVHLRLGIDPKNMRKGLAPLKSALREIASDNVAANFSYALLKNFGVTSIFMTPKDGVTIKPEDADYMKSEIKRRTSGDQAGSPIVIGAPVEAKQLSFSPDKLNVEQLRYMPEHRVCALLGVSPMVVGFGSGMGGATFSNVSEAREAAYENNIIPTQRTIAPQLKTQLLADKLSPMSAPESPESLKQLTISFDLSQVRVLATDEDALHKRAATDLASGAVTVNEYRETIGLQPVPDGNVYLRSTAIQPVAPEMVNAQIEAARAGLEAARNIATQPQPESPQSAIVDESSAAKQSAYTQKAAHEFSTVQVNLYGTVGKQMKDFAATIPDADLALGGREDEPHVTVKYGLHTNDAKDVQTAIAGVAPFSITLDAVDYFSAEDYDVVYVPIESDELKALNRQISDTLAHTTTHPTYTPHATIAYVKSGIGETYKGKTFLTVTDYAVQQLTFSSKDGKREAISLSPVA